MKKRLIPDQKDRRVLLLNLDEQVHSLVSWQKAVTLLLKGKARKPYEYDEYYEILLANGESYKLPKAIVLMEYMKVRRRKASPTRRNILRRDGYKCQYCACELSPASMTVDHVVPSSRGENSWTNLVASCKRCNEKKGPRTPEEAKMTLLSRPTRPATDNLIVVAYALKTGDQWSRWV